MSSRAASLHNTDPGGRVAKGDFADSGASPGVSEAERQRRRVERSRKGGLALKAKYGREHFVQMGRRGGRPTWQEELAKARKREAQHKRSRPPKE